MKLQLLNGPAVEPVSLDEAKQWLRLDGNDEDQLLSALIVSARLIIEAYTRRSLITQNWRLIADGWPEATAGSCSPVIAIPFAPFQRVAAIRVYDADNVAQSVPTDALRILSQNDRTNLQFLVAPPLPGRSFDGVEIDVAIGYGDNPADVPEPLRRAILMLVAYWRENRGDTQISGVSISLQAKAAAAPYRRARLI
jgi:uncharacterized phiE125 gp8 family phage protein